MTITKICLVCQIPFKSEKWQKQKYCSHNCQLKSLRTGKNISCEQCGNVFYTSGAGIKKNRRYCSNRCSADFKKIAKVIVQCSFCKAKFETTQWKVNHSVRKFCSNICYQKMLDTKKLLKVCEGCGKEFIVPLYTKKHNYGKYCSKKCLVENKDSRITKQCKKCGKKFKIGKTEINEGRGQYCSIKCRTKERVIKECRVCKKRFFIIITEANKGHGKYCSIECARKDFPRRMHIKPNYSELKLQSILNELFPNEYHLNVLGNIIIDRKIPDFVNCNGQKKIIELFGEHVHPKSDEQKRKKAFAKYGYKTLIVWNSALRNRAQLQKKLIQFHTIL